MNSILDFFAMDGVIKALVMIFPVFVIALIICHAKGKGKIFIQKALIICATICELLIVIGCSVRSMKEEECDLLPFIIFIMSIMSFFVSFMLFGFAFAVCKKKMHETKKETGKDIAADFEDDKIHY